MQKTTVNSLDTIADVLKQMVSESALPEISADDAGKVLMVAEDGTWTLGTLPSTEE